MEIHSLTIREKEYKKATVKIIRNRDQKKDSKTGRDPISLKIVGMYNKVLNEKSKELLPKFKGFKHFYLAGGTGLALQIGHRISVDFDFFSPKSVTKNLLKQCEKTFAGAKISVSVNNSDELTIFINGIKTTFLHYHYPVIGRLLSYKGIKILNAKEIGATKAYTIGRRGSFKDYVDLYSIMSLRISSLEEIIRLAEKKYADVFNSRLFLEQLLYFEDLDETKLIFLTKPFDKLTIAKFFRAEIRKIKL